MIQFQPPKNENIALPGLSAKRIFINRSSEIKKLNENFGTSLPILIRVTTSSDNVKVRISTSSFTTSPNPNSYNLVKNGNSYIIGLKSTAIIDIVNAGSSLESASYTIESNSIFESLPTVYASGYDNALNAAVFIGSGLDIVRCAYIDICNTGFDTRTRDGVKRYFLVGGPGRFVITPQDIRTDVNDYGYLLYPVNSGNELTTENGY